MWMFFTLGDLLGGAEVVLAAVTCEVALAFTICWGCSSSTLLLFFPTLSFLGFIIFWSNVVHYYASSWISTCKEEFFFPPYLKEMRCFSSPPLHLNQCIKVGEEKSLWVFKRHLGKILNFQSLCYWNKFLIVRNHTSTITNESKLAHCEGDCTFVESIPELHGCA